MTTTQMIALAAGAQFVLIALAALIAPLRMKKVMVVSALILAGGWCFAFETKADKKVAEASTVSTRQREGSCASIRNGMPGKEVRQKLGMPDEVRSDDKVRGPGSTVLIYKDLRCAVHLFEERVELVD